MVPQYLYYWPCPLDIYVESNLLCLWMSFFTQKINIITQLIIKILLLYHFQILWTCPTMSDCKHLIFMNQLADFMDAYPHTKNQPHPLSNSWDIADLSFWGTLNMPNHVRLQTSHIHEWITRFCGCLPTSNKPHTHPHSWVIADLSLWITLGMSNHLRLQLSDIHNILWACPTMSDHTHLIFMNHFAT